MRTYLEILNEAKQVGTLYHFTDGDGLYHILKTNTMKGNKQSQWKNTLKIKSENRYDKEIAICLTRDSNLPARMKGDMIDRMIYRITLDGNKISENYRIKPIDIFNVREVDKMGRKMSVFMKNEYAKRKREQSEERVLTNEIKNIKKYIQKIDVAPHWIMKNEDDIEEFYELVNTGSNLSVWDDTTDWMEKEFNLNSYEELPTLDYNDDDIIKKIANEHSKKILQTIEILENNLLWDGASENKEAVELVKRFLTGNYDDEVWSFDDLESQRKIIIKAVNFEHEKLNSYYYDVKYLNDFMKDCLELIIKSAS